MSGPFTEEQKKFMSLFPDAVESAKKSEEFEFFRDSNNPMDIFMFVKVFKIISNKNLQFLKDVVDGDTKKVKKFLRINKSKKDDTTMRIAVNVCCTFMKAEMLDIIIKSVSSAFLSKFVYVFMPLVFRDVPCDDIVAGYENVEEDTKDTILKWTFKEKKINLNTHRFKSQLFPSTPVCKIIEFVDKGVIEVDEEEMVELFHLFCQSKDQIGSDDAEDIFQLFHPHDYFLQKFRFHLEELERQEFYDTIVATPDDESIVPKEDDDDVSEQMVHVDKESTNAIDFSKKASGSLAERFNIQGDVSDEDIIEFLLLFGTPTFDFLSRWYHK